MKQRIPKVGEYWKWHFDSSIIKVLTLKTFSGRKKKYLNCSCEAEGVVVKCDATPSIVGTRGKYFFGKVYDEYWEYISDTDGAYIMRDIYNELEEILCSQ